MQRVLLSFNGRCVEGAEEGGKLLLPAAFWVEVARFRLGAAVGRQEVVGREQARPRGASRVCGKRARGCAALAAGPAPAVLGPQHLSPVALHRQACPALLAPRSRPLPQLGAGPGRASLCPKPRLLRARGSCRLSKCWGPSRWCPCGRVLASLTLASEASASQGAELF